jgi:O-antigen/teichoic acid export membrane protein
LQLNRQVPFFYFSQLAVAVIGIGAMPVYFDYLGAEAFGLVGFFAILQALFQLLDVGLTPTMLREVSLYRGGQSDVSRVRQLLRILEFIFICLAAIVVTVFVLSVNVIAAKWLNVVNLSQQQVSNALILMIVSVSLRWISALYRGTITGFECFGWLGGFSIFIATLRFLLVIPFLAYVSSSPVHFFLYQLSVSGLELIICFGKAQKLLPLSERPRFSQIDFGLFRDKLSFSLSIAATSALWVLVTQLDKLFLSGLISLDNYGFFSLGTLIASGILILAKPLSSTLLPILSRLEGEGRRDIFRQTYRNSTQVACLIAMPATAILVFFPDRVLQIWLNDPGITEVVAPVLIPYAIGNCALAISSFAFYMQFAKGHLKLHLIGTALFLALLIPSVYLLALAEGAPGAGRAWLLVNLAYLLLWVPVIHNIFEPKLHLSWLGKDVIPVFVVSASSSWALSYLQLWTDVRLWDFWILLAIGIIVFLLSTLASPVARRYLAGAASMLGKVR